MVDQQGMSRFADEPWIHYVSITVFNILATVLALRDPETLLNVSVCLRAETDLQGMSRFADEPWIHWGIAPYTIPIFKMKPDLSKQILFVGPIYADRTMSLLVRLYQSGTVKTGTTSDRRIAGVGTIRELFDCFRAD